MSNLTLYDYRQFNLNVLGLLLATQEAVKLMGPAGNDVSGILAAGGTILGTSREEPQRMPLPNGKTVDRTERAVETYRRRGNSRATPLSRPAHALALRPRID